MLEKAKPWSMESTFFFQIAYLEETSNQLLEGICFQFQISDRYIRYIIEIVIDSSNGIKKNKNSKLKKDKIRKYIQR